MESGTVVLEEMSFRGTEFAVKVELTERLLTVEISDVVSTDQWRGEFDPAYIEDLTRKTGNFKQFPVFCSMLESAVNRSSDSVTLDLLTYSDLELLRNRKAGVVGRPCAQPQSTALSAKRYLILIYTVEFDRIHYPLPLPYLGKPDPAQLQKEIRALRVELKTLRGRGDYKASDHETRKLRAELAMVKDEKAKALERLQMVGSSSASGSRGHREAVRNLEEQLMKERAKSQRSASKMSQEQRLLIEQLEEVKASERALRTRVKSLTTEIALLRRGTTSGISGRSGFMGDREIRRSLSRETSLTRTGLRGRSGSRERLEDRGRRSEERVRRADSSGSRNCIRPSPSPTGSRGRFDPTTYIHDRQRRQKEADLKNNSLVNRNMAYFESQRKIRRDMLASPSRMERGRSRSRESVPQLMRAGSAGRGRSVSMESRRSRCSSDGSVAEFEELSKPLNCRGSKLVYNGPSVTRGRHSKKPMCSTPAQRMRDSSIYTGTDLSEINARILDLQNYMDDLDTGR